MKNLILIILLLIPVNLMAKTWKDYPFFPKWNKIDIMLQSTFIVVTTIDLMQTYTFLYTKPHGEEWNPIMGSHPSKKRFFAVGGGFILLHTTFCHIAPLPARRFAQIFFISTETMAIGYNYSVGIRISLK